MQVVNMWRTRTISFVNAAVLGPYGRVFGSIRVRGGAIDSLGAAPDRRDLVIDLDNAVVLPGLINAHDHLELNSFGRLKWRERYENVCDWIADFQPRFRADPALAAATRATLEDRLRVGALKNLLAGVTTVCHHNPVHRSLTRRYPLRVIRKFTFSHSLGIDGDSLAAVHRQTRAEWPWIVHAAEGVDAGAAAEVERLEELGCLTPNTVLVHGVAVSARLAARVIERGASLVWCPTSNDFLFGTTADVRPFDDACRLALGSDSRLSGEGDLLDELRAAHATRQLSPRSLVRAVTDGAARILRVESGGQLARGAPADLCVIRRLAPDPYDAVVMARRADVRLTMIDGHPLVSDADLSTVFDRANPATPVRVDGIPKLLARSLAAQQLRRAIAEPGLEVAAC
jgi:cytosine/adenosine deaminase-related metal-dependent hydrolase